MKKYLYMIAALFGIDYFCKENIEAQKPEDFPRDMGKSHGKIRLYRNHNDGFCFGVKKEKKELPQGKESIKLEHVGYTYNPGSAYEMHALKDVNLEIPQGQFVGIIGHTGSGKSTLIQHFNGLIRPTEGHIYFEGQDIWADKFPLRGLRSQVGLVFQYPEHQLFETDVLTDVCFGPKNQNLPPEECEKRAKEALEHVGLDESYYAKSPFELSGGQKRRVAIAGVLAMNPKVLILDEPTAGLDPAAADSVLELFDRLHRSGHTLVLITHDERAAQCAARRMHLENGCLFG